MLALSVFAAWLLWRSRRAHVARLVAERADAEAAAELALWVWGAVLLVAAFAAPSIAGDWFAGRQLVAGLPMAAALCAWGMRHAPRTGAVLGALTLRRRRCGSLLAFAFGDAGGWADHGTNAPLGPAVELLPRSGSVGVRRSSRRCWPRRSRRGRARVVARAGAGGGLRRTAQ